jgi:xylan 1,4-beta-xylosidase
MGLCAFGDRNNAIGVAFYDGRIITWRRDHGAMRQLAQQPAPESAKLFLQMTVQRGSHFQFAFSSDGQEWTSTTAAADKKDLPPWDLSVRVALTVGGPGEAAGVFDSFSIRPL